MHLKFDWLIGFETLRMRDRLFVNPNDETALGFFTVLREWQATHATP